MKKESLMDVLGALTEKCSGAVDGIRKDLGLTSSEYKGLVSLHPEEKISCREFSSRIELSVSRCSRVIERLFKKGIVERMDCTSDRRFKSIWLTSKGVQVRKSILSRLDLCEEKLMANITDERLSGLKSELKELAARL